LQTKHKGDRAFHKRKYRFNYLFADKVRQLEEMNGMLFLFVNIYLTKYL
jgi:hypothetical protein